MRGQFERLNAQLIKARKTVQERDRILSLMAAIDCQLSERQRELSLLVTQLKYEKQDVAALEGMSLQAAYFSLLGRKDERLAKEVAEYLEMKTAVSKCRLTMASLESQLQNFEADLVVLADCDDEYEAVKQEKLAFLTSLGNADSQHLSELNDKLAASRTAYQQLKDALDAGREAVTIIAEIGSASANKVAELIPILQESLDDYQNKLKVISYQHSSALQAKKSPNRQSDHSHGSSLGTVGTALVTAGLVLLVATSSLDLSDLFLLPSFQSADSDWLLHIKNLRSQILKKEAVLAEILVWLNEEVDKYQRKVEGLMMAMWQVDNFVDSEAQDAE